MSVSHSHNKCDNTPKTTVLLWSLIQRLNVPESKSNSPYSMFKLHTSDSISAILSKIPILTDIQLAITLSKHSDHLAFFRRTLGTRLGSKYKPYWNYI